MNTQPPNPNDLCAKCGHELWQHIQRIRFGGQWEGVYCDDGKCRCQHFTPKAEGQGKREVAEEIASEMPSLTASQNKELVSRITRHISAHTKDLQAEVERLEKVCQEWVESNAAMVHEVKDLLRQNKELTTQLALQTVVLDLVLEYPFTILNVDFDVGGKLLKECKRVRSLTPASVKTEMERVARMEIVLFAISQVKEGEDDMEAIAKEAQRALAKPEPKEKE